MEAQIGSEPIVVSSSSPSNDKGKLFEEIDNEPHIPQLDLMIQYANTAFSLTRKLSMGISKKQKESSKSGSFTPQGVASLIKDITELNANGSSIHRIAFNLLKDYGAKSGVDLSVKTVYETVLTLYSELNKSIPKFSVREGLLPALNLLKSLNQSP